jgi:hypothetical protein
MPSPNSALAQRMRQESKVSTVHRNGLFTSPQTTSRLRFMITRLTSPAPQERLHQVMPAATPIVPSDVPVFPTDAEEPLSAPCSQSVDFADFSFRPYRCRFALAPSSGVARR